MLIFIVVQFLNALNTHSPDIFVTFSANYGIFGISKIHLLHVQEVQSNS